MVGFKRKSTPTEASELQVLAGQLVSTAPGTSKSIVATPAQNLSPGKDYRDGIQEVCGIIDVPLPDIRENPWNSRRVFVQSKIDELSAWMLAEGQLVPAAGFIDSAGRVTLIEGHRRLRAAILAGLPTLRIELRRAPVSDQELYLLSRNFNVERENQTSLDDAIAWKLLLERRVFASQAALAKALRLSEPIVSKTLALADLPSAVISAIAEVPGLHSLKVLYAIFQYWKSLGDDKALALVAEAAEKNLSSKDIDARRNATERGSTQKPRSIRRSFSFDGAKGEIRRFESDGRLEFVIRGLRSEALVDLEDRIAMLLAASPELPLN